MADLATIRQVIVFSHDDRLPEAVRRMAGNARIVEVTRSAGSVVTLNDALDPARRDIDDARALTCDPNVDPVILRRVVPRLCRSAVETAARDAYFARSFAAGLARHDVESAWTVARNQSQRIALALHGDAQRAINSWLDAKPHRRAALTVCGAGSHTGLSGDTRKAAAAVRDVEQLVAEIAAAGR